MRNVIALGDVAFHQGDLIGDTLALMVRLEEITPPDEIYLTVAARLALASAEIQTGPVDSSPCRASPSQPLYIASCNDIAPILSPAPTC
jgi:hypothetical protein